MSHSFDFLERKNIENEFRESLNSGIRKDQDQLIGELFERKENYGRVGRFMKLKLALLAGSYYY